MDCRINDEDRATRSRLPTRSIRAIGATSSQRLATPDPYRVPRDQTQSQNRTRASKWSAQDHLAAQRRLTGPPLIDDAIELELANRPVPVGDYRDRATWERHAAFNLVIGAQTLFSPQPGVDDDEDDAQDPDIGYRLLGAGDLAGALTVADALLVETSNTPEDDWNYGNLVHHTHILRGKVFLVQGDASAAAAEFMAAGETPGSPQLDSFGPDLSLAWALLGGGEDSAVLSYLHQIAQFWSPDDPVADHVDLAKSTAAAKDRAELPGWSPATRCSRLILP